MDNIDKTENEYDVSVKRKVASGTAWLFLEKVFPNDWQLWRSTIPPKGESKLMREKTDNP